MDYEQLRKTIDDKLATDPEFSTLVKRINSGRANFIDTSRYSQILSQTIGKELSKSIESITDKEAITQQLLKDSYNEINDVCARVQEMIDSDAGVHINPQQASFPKERVESFSHSLVDLTVDSDVIRRRARAGSETITKSFHDSYIKKNAQFRNDAGFNCYIVREGRSCCKWCADVAGKYKFGEQPDGIFRRHDNCNCTIIYDGQTMRGKFNSDGTRSKTWEEIPDAEADFSPTVLSKAEAEKIERRNLGNFRGLYIDKSAESDIIKTDKVDYRRFSNGEEVNQFFYYDSDNHSILAKKKSQYSQWVKNLSDETKEAIDDYSTDGYDDINRYWRKIGDWENINKDKVLYQTEKLDNAISSFELKDNIKVYRGIDLGTIANMFPDAEELSDLRGKIYSDKAFSSTSPISDVAKRFVEQNWQDGIMLELDIPSGTGKGAYLDALSAFGESIVGSDQAEYEFLLKRGAKFEIYDIDETNPFPILKGRWVE